jgi:hypothetical protein
LVIPYRVVIPTPDRKLFSLIKMPQAAPLPYVEDKSAFPAL